ncbi:hypothetical protein LguiB_005490 [Lonicera macranthoides]
MELYYVSLLSLFVTIIVSTLLVLHFLQFNKKNSSQSPPPGKKGWPVIGETLEFLNNPEKFMRDRMAKYCPAIFSTNIIGEQCAVMCGAAGNKFLFSNENKLVEVWWPSNMDKVFPSSTQTTSKEETLKLRRILPNFFKPNMLERYVGTMDKVAQDHFAASWENQERVVVYPLTKRFTFSLACRLFVSLESKEGVAELAQRFDQIAPGLFSLPLDLPGTPYRGAINAAKYIRKKILVIIQQRKIDLAEGRALDKQDDILSHMLQTCVDDKGTLMKDLDIADKLLGLLVGGHDSVNSTCTSIVKYLAEQPDIYEQVYKEQMEIAKSKSPGELLNWEDLQKMKYSWNFTCEVLRVATPLQGAFRESLSDFVYNGFLIPKGWKLHWSSNTTHKSPEIFPQPQKFDPTRFEGKGPAPYTFVPFGGGPRMCPGKEFARLELLVFIHHLVKRFKFELEIPNEKITVNPMPIPVKGLPIRLHPHTL